LIRAIFLDRDGVINKAVMKSGIPHPPKSLDELELLPGVVDAVLVLKKLGLKIIVITNQPDVSRGTASKESVESFNSFLGASLGIDVFYVCFHDDSDGCFCRKPNPGMLISAAKTHNVDLTASFLVGDRWRDISAGQAAGCLCYFIDYSYLERRPIGPYVSVSSLLEAANDIERKYSETQIE
jgi:D-glycero-D-manno-heptose 1,7-bisphosphate phosphatase